MAPRWIAAVDEALQCRVGGVILSYNTGDRVLLGEPGLEVAALRHALAHHFAGRGYHVGLYTYGAGFEVLRSPAAPPPDSADPFKEIPRAAQPELTLPAATRALRQAGSNAVIVIDYADHLVPRGEADEWQLRCLELIHSWSQDDEIKRTQNFPILISHEDRVTQLLAQGGFRAIAIDLPNAEERAAFAAYLERRRHSGYQNTIGVLDSGFDGAGFVRTTAGLRLSDIEYLYRRSGVHSSPITREDVRQTKRRAIQELGRGLIEVIEPTKGFDSIAGAHHVKEYFNWVRQVWNGHAASAPANVLLAGVPGVGKSFIVSALGYELGVPVLVMRTVKEAWVGASERNLERVLQITESLSPCILWQDEIDQAIGGRTTGESGDPTRGPMLARIFEFFGSMAHRGRILWLATSNRPDLLDPALLDRFQVVIPFIHPTLGERVELFPLLAQQVGRKIERGVDIATVASHPQLDALTARSLQEIVVAAGMRSDLESGSANAVIGERHLLAAIADHVPANDPVEHEFLALKALQNASFNSLLPWMSLSGKRNGCEWPSYVGGVVDPDTGNLRPDALAQRLNELDKLRLGRRLSR